MRLANAYENQSHFQMSTLLSDLDSSPGAPGGSDGDLVNQILREMNTGSGAQGPPPMPPMAPPPPSPASMAVNPGVIMAPSSNVAVGQHMMDMNPATAHMINGSHPTPADFAGAIHGVPTSQNAIVNSGAPRVQQPAFEYPKRSWSKRLVEEVKTPILVSLLVFVFSLPVINFLFAHYVPRLVLPTGQLNAVGQLVKALSAGAAFWLLQRVIVPLFNM